MGRHSQSSADSSSSRLLIPAILALVAVVALIVIAVMWFSNSDDTEDATTATTAASTTAASAAHSSAAASTAPGETTSSNAMADPAHSTSAAPEAEPESQAAAAGTDTLFVLDMSLNIGPYHPALVPAISNGSDLIRQAGGETALWNYSSPLSGARPVGYRDNTGFGTTADLGDIIARFGTAGVPQTREAVLAAVDTAADRAAETGEMSRVVIVTTGSADAGDDQAFIEQVQARTSRGPGVHLAVVHLGDGPADNALTQVADYYHTDTATDAETLSQVIRQAVAPAAG